MRRLRRRQVLGKKEHTVTKKQRTSCIFDHILFFEFKDLSKEELQAAVIKVSVYDANPVRKNTLIGLFNFDLINVYYQEHHEVRGKGRLGWMAAWCTQWMAHTHTFYVSNTHTRTHTHSHTLTSCPCPSTPNRRCAVSVAPPLCHMVPPSHRSRLCTG